MALEALSGDKTLQEIAVHYEVHPTKVGTWRDRAKSQLRQIFQDDSEPQSLSIGPFIQFVGGCLLGVGALVLLYFLASLLV